MALELFTAVVAVDSTGYNSYVADTTDPFLVKNVGANVVYVGRVSLSNTDPININNSWPLEPGETVLVPGYDTPTGGASFTVGFNTASGTSQVRILDHRNL